MSESEVVNLVTLGICLMIVVVWAITRARRARDSEGRQLQRNLRARFAYVTIHVVIFLVLAGLIEFGGERVENFAVLSLGDEVFSAVQQLGGAVMAFIALAVIYQTPFFQEPDEAFLIWLYEASHREADAALLEACLIQNPFTPSPSERQRNLASLEEHEVYISDPDTGFIDGTTINAWRKVQTLLHHAKAWSKEKSRVLNDEEAQEIEDVDRTHKRKTRLAMDIIRMFVAMERKGTDPQTMARIREQLASMPHQDRDQVDAIEHELKGALSVQVGRGEAATPVVLSSGEFSDMLRRIQSYFQVEYQILLRRVSQLAAKSIIFAGDAAPDRLETLKAAGYGGLGRLEPFTFSRVLMAFLLIIVGVFLVLFLLVFVIQPMTGLERSEVKPETFAVVPLTIAFASLCGAVAGSNRSLGTQVETPWLSFLGAGLVSVAIHFAVNVGAAGFGSIIGSPPVDPNAFDASNCSAAVPPPRTFKELAAGALFPFAIAVGLARLARLKLNDHDGSLKARLKERLIDGTMLSIVVALAILATIAISVVIQTPFGLYTESCILPEPRRMFVICVFAGAIGMIIGMVMVSDIRRAARSELVDLNDGSVEIRPMTRAVSLN